MGDRIITMHLFLSFLLFVNVKFYKWEGKGIILNTSAVPEWQFGCRTTYLIPELHLLNCSGGNNLTASEFEPSRGETLFVSACWQANIQLSVPFMFYLGFYHSFYLLSLVPLCSLCTPISPGVSLLNGASFWENEIPYPHRPAAFGLCLSIPGEETPTGICPIRPSRTDGLCGLSV